MSAPIQLAIAVLVFSVLVGTNEAAQKYSPEAVQQFSDPIKGRLMQNLFQNKMNDDREPISEEEAIARGLVLLARAVARDVPFNSLKVAPKVIKTFCHLQGSRQCREACFHFGDSACADGNIGYNGNDNQFILGRFHPGR